MHEALIDDVKRAIIPKRYFANDGTLRNEVTSRALRF